MPCTGECAPDPHAMMPPASTRAPKLIPLGPSRHCTTRTGVNRPLHVDVHVIAVLAQDGDMPVQTEQKALQHERRVRPGAIELSDVHPLDEVGDRNRYIHDLQPTNIFTRPRQATTPSEQNSDRGKPIL